MSKTLDNSIKALLLIDLNNQLLTIDLEKEESLTSKQLEALSQIEAKVTQQAKSLLQMALLNEEYDFARNLSSFYNLISSDILVVALMKRNANLVEFLAKDLGLPIHSYPITTKERTFNAVEYCFSEGSSDSVLDCFSVLIKQGANLMQPVGPDKLPLAHLLFLQNQNTFIRCFRTKQNLNAE